MAKTEPSVDQWLREAKADPAAAQCGMFLTHNGVVRITPKAQVREGVEDLGEVVAVEFSYDAEGLAAAEAEGLIAEVGATSMKEMGKVMGVASKRLAGRADGKDISAKVRELLA